MFCTNCGTKQNEGTKFCGECGNPMAGSVSAPAAAPAAPVAPVLAPQPSTSAPLPPAPAPAPTPAPAFNEPATSAQYVVTPTERSPHSWIAALLLCFFLGSLGIHRFLVGKVGTGIAMIFTLGGLGVWTLIDFIMICVGSFRDIQGRELKP